MITFFRIDERMIHGQIAIKYSKHTGVSHIIVANDAAAANSVVTKSLKMAAPSGIKTAIKSVADAIKLLQDPRAQALKILLLVNSPGDALRILPYIEKPKFINIGNYGRIAPVKVGKPRKTYGNNIYLDTDEVEEIKKIMNQGIRCYYQTTPEEPSVDLNKML